MQTSVKGGFIDKVLLRVSSEKLVKPISYKSFEMVRKNVLISHYTIFYLILFKFSCFLSFLPKYYKKFHENMKLSLCFSNISTISYDKKLLDKAY